MADDFFGDDEIAPASGGANPAALNAALNGPSAATDEARAFLRAQEQLTKLQAKILHEEHALELSHFKWRRFNDQMKGALQMAAGALIVGIVFAIAAILWSASRAEGLVVDTFTVPPQLAQAGMTGDVVADDLTHKIASVRDIANGNSIAHSKDVKNERDEEIRVEIPDTGISFAELWRYLRGWLGHEQHLRGNLRMTADGGVALTVSLNGADAATFAGRTGDLDRLEEQAAEHVFQDVDPSNYILYLYAQNRTADSLVAIKHLIAISDSPAMLADGYALWGNWTHRAGDLSSCLKREMFAAAVDPRALPPHMEMMNTYLDVGSDEAALREALKIPAFRQDEQYAWKEGRGFSDVVAAAISVREFLTGDFAGAMSQSCGYCSSMEELLGRAEYAARMHDVARGRALVVEAVSGGSDDREDMARAQYFIDAESGDWRKAVEDARTFEASIVARSEELRAIRVRAYAYPLLAVALAQTGDFAAAHAAIDKTAGDCVACETTRGEIDGLQKNDGGAQFWFARVTRDAPSIPFAYAAWGAMLLREGKYDAAITKFKLAHEKGPQFADPLEMWGEALMLENRSDLALAKFEEAGKYAPNWGRLHLEWGKALFYAGRKDEAAKQFAIASSLELSPADTAQLAQWIPHHG